MSDLPHHGSFPRRLSCEWYIEMRCSCWQSHWQATKVQEEVSSTQWFLPRNRQFSSTDVCHRQVPHESGMISEDTVRDWCPWCTRRPQGDHQVEVGPGVLGNSTLDQPLLQSAILQSALRGQSGAIRNPKHGYTHMYIYI